MTAVPSRLTALWGLDPTGWVDVRWDLTGIEDCYRMGRDNRYELELL